MYKQLKINWRRDNCMHLLQNGAEFFSELCHAIDNAKRSVHLETYIFNLDDTGYRILESLKNAAQRGIRVRVVIDGWGSQLHAQEIHKDLVSSGASCRIYKPHLRLFKYKNLSLSKLRRMHRKTAVIDSSQGFVGGINILDDLHNVPMFGEKQMPRFDFAVSLKGPVVLDLLRAQRALWLRMNWRKGNLDEFQQWFMQLVQKRQKKMLANITTYTPGIKAALLLRDNVVYRRKIENVYIDAMANAKHEVLIANAYFFPGKKIKKALKKAAQRGIKVTLLLQGQPEYNLQFWASRYMYADLINCDILLYEYQPSYLHAKVAVIDDFAMVGSANLDPFSSLLALESNVWIEDQGFAHKLKQSLQYQIDHNSKAITPDYLKKRSLWGKALDVMGYFMLRLGVVITGKSSEY